MAATSRRVFAALGIEVAGAEVENGAVLLRHAEEDPDYHGLGILDGANHGVDPGKWQVYKHAGAQELLGRHEAAVYFLWDPDGDRFNMVTTAPAAVADRAAAAGLEVDPLDAERCLVCFRPNQIYFLLTALKLESLLEAGELARNDWIVATTWPTSRSIGELTEAFHRLHDAPLATYRVPVGFKHFAAFVTDLEEQLEADPPPGGTWAVDVTGAEVRFGPRPRLAIMAEESGGAAMGPEDWLVSRDGSGRSLASKEKDGMQIGVMALALAARLHLEGGSFAGWYLDRLERYGIRHRFYERRDVTLADESLRGEAREAARAAGNARKTATVEFFRSLETMSPSAAGAALRARLPADVAEEIVPPVERVFWAGDGTLIEFPGQWFQLRASGTDAVLRYYIEGQERGAVARLNEALTRLAI
jgi:phosphomannomutase